MAERDSWWVGGSVMDQADARFGTAALWTPGTSAINAKTGIRPGPASPGTVSATGTPDANVHVSPFQAVLADARATPSGAYLMTLDATKTINILSTPAHATNPRNDLIIAHQADTFYGDGNSTMTVRQVVGTPAGVPADPSTAAYPNALLLARVRVNATATTITTGNITDLRPTVPWTVGVGGMLPVPSQAARGTLTGIYDGYPIYRTDREWVEVHDGTGWRVQGVAVVTSFADLSIITSPYPGQVAYNTGDTMMYRYTGATWITQGTYRVVNTLGGTAASVTFASIPTTLRRLRLEWSARSTDAGFVAHGLNLTINGVGGTAYNTQYMQASNASVIAGSVYQSASSNVGVMPSATAVANNYGRGEIRFTGWDNPHTSNLGFGFESIIYDNSITTSWHQTGGGIFRSNGPYTSVTLTPAAGLFAAGCQFILTGSD